jgi:SAM-dependent methyltransferase
MKQKFERIYERNYWKHGSGEGSLPVHTRSYASFLQNFIRDQNIRSVVDFGCGDWQFSRKIDWAGVEYRGYDIVGSVILENTCRYGTPNTAFYEIQPPYESLQPADLLIVKDVFQHWSDESIREFFPVLPRFRYSLITNCVNPFGPTTNRAITDGDFRYLDIRMPPFDLAAWEVFSFTNHRTLFGRVFGKPRWLKKVFLLKADDIGPTRLWR